MPVKLRRKPFSSNQGAFGVRHDESMVDSTWFSSKPKRLEDKLNDAVALASLLMMFGMITVLLVNR